MCNWVVLLFKSLGQYIGLLILVFCLRRNFLLFELLIEINYLYYAFYENTNIKDVVLIVLRRTSLAWDLVHLVAFRSSITFEIARSG
jgi:hypothetical protein